MSSDKKRSKIARQQKRKAAAAQVLKNKFAAEQTYKDLLKRHESSKALAAVLGMESFSTPPTPPA